MKKKIKRFLPVLACLLLLSGLFAMPVSAAGTGWSSSHVPFYEFYGPDAFYQSNEDLRAFVEPQGSGLDYDLLPLTFLKDNGGIVGGVVPYTGIRYQCLNSSIVINEFNYTKGQLIDFNVPAPFFPSLNLSSGDVLYIDIPWLRFALNPSYGTLKNISFTYSLRSSSGSATHYSVDVTNFNTGTSGNYYLKDYTLKIGPVAESSEFYFSDFITFTYAFSGIANIDGKMSFVVDDGFNYSFGNPNSPEAPKYDKPDDGGAVGDLDDLEGQVGEQSQQGMDSANDTFKGFGAALSEFTLGLQFVSVLMRTFIFKMPWLNALFTISLGLGLFGFIVGLAGYAIGAHDRKVVREHMRNEKRKIWREEAKNHYSKKG